MDNYLNPMQTTKNFSRLRMDNYLGRVVGEVAHAGKHKPYIDLFHKIYAFVLFQQPNSWVKHQLQLSKLQKKAF